MKKLILALLIPVSVFAQDKPVMINKQVYCYPVDVVFRVLSEPDIKEEPVFIGTDESKKSEVAIFVNSKTNAYTIVQFTAKTACVLSIGTDSKLIPLPRGI